MYSIFQNYFESTGWEIPHTQNQLDLSSSCQSPKVLFSVSMHTARYPQAETGVFGISSASRFFYLFKVFIHWRYSSIIHYSLVCFSPFPESSSSSGLSIKSLGFDQVVIHCFQKLLKLSAEQPWVKIFALSESSAGHQNELLLAFYHLYYCTLDYLVLRLHITEGYWSKYPVKKHFWERHILVIRPLSANLFWIHLLYSTNNSLIKYRLLGLINCTESRFSVNSVEFRPGK